MYGISRTIPCWSKYPKMLIASMNFLPPLSAWDPELFFSGMAASLVCLIRFIFFQLCASLHCVRAGFLTLLILPGQEVCAAMLSVQVRLHYHKNPFRFFLLYFRY